MHLQAQVLQVHASEALLAYVQDLVEATRSGQWFAQGLSPRAGVALLRAAKAKALMAGRDYVAPDDVQAVWHSVAAHRLVPLRHPTASHSAQVQALLASVALP